MTEATRRASDSVGSFRDFRLQLHQQIVQFRESFFGVKGFGHSLVVLLTTLLQRSSSE
jgi:hypothetical protein